MAGTREGHQGEFWALVDFDLADLCVDVLGGFPGHVGGAIAIGEGRTAGEVSPEAAFESEKIFGIDAEARRLAQFCTKVRILELDQVPDRGWDGENNLVGLDRFELLVFLRLRVSWVWGCLKVFFQVLLGGVCEFY
jgi:hypothetical protein